MVALVIAGLIYLGAWFTWPITMLAIHGAGLVTAGGYRAATGNWMLASTVGRIQAIASRDEPDPEEPDDDGTLIAHIEVQISGDDHDEVVLREVRAIRDQLAFEQQRRKEIQGIMFGPEQPEQSEPQRPHLRVVPPTDD